MGVSAALMRISAFRVEAIENVGSSVDPRWHARVRAIARIVVTTYQTAERGEGATIVSPLRRPGDSVVVFCRTTSILYAGEWSTTVEFEGQPFTYYFRRVMETGESFTGREVLAKHRRTKDGPIEDRYYEQQESRRAAGLEYTRQGSRTTEPGVFVGRVCGSQTCTYMVRRASGVEEGIPETYPPTQMLQRMDTLRPGAPVRLTLRADSVFLAGSLVRVSEHVVDVRRPE